MSYAMNGEDRWILEQFPNGYRGFAVDVGAYDGVLHSNTLLLEMNLWTVLCIEPNPAMAKRLLLNRPFVQAVACGAEPQAEAKLSIHKANQEAYTSLKPTINHPVWHPEPGAEFIDVKVEVRTLDQCLEKAEFPRLDVASIDTEGTELDVLKGFDLAKWQPKALVVEAWDEDNPVVPYLEQRGYRRAKRILVNDCYLRDRGSTWNVSAK